MPSVWKKTFSWMSPWLMLVTAMMMSDSFSAFKALISSSENSSFSLFSNQNLSLSLSLSNCSLMILVKRGPGPPYDSSIPPTYRSMFIRSPLYFSSRRWKMSGFLANCSGLISLKLFIMGKPKHFLTVL